MDFFDRCGYFEDEDEKAVTKRPSNKRATAEATLVDNDRPVERRSAAKARQHIDPNALDLYRSLSLNMKTGEEFHGGYVVMRNGADGDPIISFVVKNLSKTDHDRIRSAGGYFNRYSQRSILRPYIDFHEKIGDLDVFNYYKPVCQQFDSLRTLYTTENRCYRVEALFKQLLEILLEFHEISSGRGGLSFLSLDTIFVDEHGRLYILPVPPVNGYKNVTMSNDLLFHGVDGADVKSDIYAIAAIAVSMGQGGWDNPCERDLPQLIIASLCGNPTLRPSLTELHKAFFARSEAPKPPAGVVRPISHSANNASQNKPSKSAGEMFQGMKERITKFMNSERSSVEESGERSGRSGTLTWTNKSGVARPIPIRDRKRGGEL